MELLKLQNHSMPEKALKDTSALFIPTMQYRFEQ